MQPLSTPSGPWRSASHRCASAASVRPHPVVGVVVASGPAPTAKPLSSCKLGTYIATQEALLAGNWRKQPAPQAFQHSRWPADNGCPSKLFQYRPGGTGPMRSGQRRAGRKCRTYLENCLTTGTFSDMFRCSSGLVTVMQANRCHCRANSRLRASEKWLD